MSGSLATSTSNVASPADVQDFRPGGINRRVLGPDGVQRGGTIVALEGPLRRAIDTAADGAFAVTTLPPGRYSLSASTPDGLTGRVSCDVVANTSSDVVLRLASVRESVSSRGTVSVVRRVLDRRANER